MTETVKRDQARTRLARRAVVNAARTLFVERGYAATTIEAISERVPGSIERHGELWHRCYATLVEHTERRLEQEIARLGGEYAHVLDEHIDSRRDDATGESWLHGRFSYVLYRRERTGAN